jgi:hypothetical protein
LLRADGERCKVTLVNLPKAMLTDLVRPMGPEARDNRAGVCILLEAITQWVARNGILFEHLQAGAS